MYWWFRKILKIRNFKIWTKFAGSVQKLGHLDDNNCKTNDYFSTLKIITNNKKVHKHSIQNTVSILKTGNYSGVTIPCRSRSPWWYRIRQLNYPATKGNTSIKFSMTKLLLFVLISLVIPRQRCKGRNSVFGRTRDLKFWQWTNYCHNINTSFV